MCCTRKKQEDRLLLILINYESYLCLKLMSKFCLRKNSDKEF